MRAVIIQGDSTQPCPDHLRGRFTCSVTSPGYVGLRSYGADYGVEPDPSEVGFAVSMERYVESIVAIGRNVRDALTPQGVFWLNIGDTNSGSGGAGGDHHRGGTRERLHGYRQGETGIAPMQRCLVPSRVALALQQDGWLVRHWITWDKGSPKREDSRHVRRPFFSTEVILMLSVGREYFWDVDHHESLPIDQRGDVWRMAPYRGRRRHSAPFPAELPQRCIALTSRPGDWVYDPCAGSGTTIEAAKNLGRHGLGVDLYGGLEWQGVAQRDGGPHPEGG